MLCMSALRLWWLAVGGATWSCLGSCSWLGGVWHPHDLGPRLQCGIGPFGFLQWWHLPLTRMFCSLGLTWAQILLQRNSSRFCAGDSYLCLITAVLSPSVQRSWPVASTSLGDATISSVSTWLREPSISSPSTSLSPSWSAANTMIIIQVSSLLLSLTKISLWVLTFFFFFQTLNWSTFLEFNPSDPSTQVGCRAC